MNRILTAIQAVMLAVSLTGSPVSGADAAAEQLPCPSGDVNLDGRVRVEDAQLLLSGYAQTLVGKPSGLTEEQLALGRVTGVNDAEIALHDCQAILMYSVRTMIGYDGEAPEVFYARFAAPLRTEPEIPQERFDQFAQYQSWASETGYPAGCLTANGAAGINMDYFHTPQDAAGYLSGRIVIGDSRCCQLGIYETRTGRDDFAAFGVWGGHYADGTSLPILSEALLADAEQCFRAQIRHCGRCAVYLFATVNDYDYTAGNHAAYIRSAVAAAERLAGLSCTFNGTVYHPKVTVIGFDGCGKTGTVFGIPQAQFNRYVDDYNTALKNAVQESSLPAQNAALFRTVPEITGGQTAFISDNLHYADDTLVSITKHILSSQPL